jgi:hypothetical protein
MASTWSALKVELQGTGDNPGTWGTATNVNLGDAVLGEAITGQATVDFPSDADVTITLTDSATTQAARNLRLNITESSTGIGSVRNLILGSGCQIEKFYLINNTGTGAKTVKNTSGTGISVPAGKATLVYNNGTNVVDAASYFTSLTLGSALPVASGGTGITSFGSGVATFLGTPSSANLAAALTDETGSGSAVFATSPTLVTPNLGTPTTLVLTSATGLPLSSGVTGTLPIANGGTGTTSTTFVNAATNITGLVPIANGGTATATPSLVQGTGVTITGTWPNQTINATGTGGTVTSVGGTGTVNGISLSGSVTTSGSLTLGGTLSGVNLASQVTGTLPVANGGTGQTALSAVTVGTSTNIAGGSNGTIPYQSASGTTQMLAAGSAGQVLQSNGAAAPTWSTPSAGAMTLISATVISGNPSSVVVTSGISSTYTKYKIIIEGLYDNTGASSQLTFQLYANGALDANNCYGSSGYQLAGGGTFSYTNSVNTSLWLPATSSVFNFNGSQSSSMYLEIDLGTIYNTSAGSYTIKALSRMQTSSFGAPRSGVVGMVYQGSSGSNSAVTGFGIAGYSEFVGTINLYGIS